MCSQRISFAARLFPGDRFTVWGPPVMFFCGLLTSFFAYPIFRYIEESPVWTRMVAARVGAAPVRAANTKGDSACLV
jgi:hypothetical protein